MMKRRANGEGTVYQRNGQGFWWIAYFGPDGKRKHESSGTLKGTPPVSC
jgi:hypothetical protein